MQLGLNALSLTTVNQLADVLPSLAIGTVPAPQDLTAGQTTDDVLNVATIFSTANTTPAADIVTWYANGSAVTAPYTFLEGDTVSIRYQKAGYAPLTYTIDTSVAGAPAVTITVTEPAFKVAPHGVFFDAEVTGFNAVAPTISDAYDPTKIDIDYSWLISKVDGNGDPITYERTYGVSDKLVTEHRNATTLFGANVAHVFTEPGDYVASVLVTERSSGKVATALTQTITVQDEDAAYPGAQTIFVDPDAVYTDAPASARTAQTIDAAYSLALNDTTPTRIQLADDKQHAITAIVESRAEHSSLLVTRAGNGTNRPELSSTVDGIKFFQDRGHGNGAGNEGKFGKFVGVEMVGGWDARTETGLLQDAFFHNAYAVGLDNGDDFHSVTADFSLIHDCVFRNFSHTFRQEHSYSIVSDCDVDGWHSFGLLCNDNDHFALIGTRMRQDRYARSGGPAYKEGVQDVHYNQHGPFRFGDNVRTLIDGCECFSRNGWTTAGSVQAEQPCGRINTNGRDGAIVNMQRNRLEGGWPVLRVESAKGTMNLAIQTVLVERSLLIGSHISQALIHTTQGGLTFRNSVGIHVNTPRLQGQVDPGVFVELRDAAAGNDRPEATGLPIRIHNNTLVSLQDPATEFYQADNPDGIYSVWGTNFTDTNGRFSDVVESHNLTHYPNASPATTPFAPLLTLAQPDAEHLGYGVAPTDMVATLPTAQATPAGSVNLYYGDAVSSAIDGVADTETLVPHRDYFGNVRPPVTDIGAIEADQVVIPPVAGLTNEGTTTILSDAGEASTYTTAAFTAAAGSNRMLLLSVTGTTRDSLSSLDVTYNGNPLTPIALTFDGTFGLPIVGAYAVLEADIVDGATATVTSSANMWACAVQVTQFNGASQTLPTAAAAPTGWTAGSTLNVAAATTSTDAIVAVLVASRQQGSTTVDIAPGTQIAQETVGGGSANVTDHVTRIAFDAPGVVGSTTYTATMTNQARTEGLAVEVLPSA